MGKNQNTDWTVAAAAGCLKKAAQRYENNAGRPFQQPVSQHALSSSPVVLTVQSQSQYYA